MLKIINQAIKDIAIDTKKQIRHVNNQITTLLSAIKNYPMIVQELRDKLNHKSRDGFRKNYIKPALEIGLIEKRKHCA